jgi:hypothetical protein
MALSRAGLDMQARWSDRARTMSFGRHVYGVGVMALGLVCLAWGGFDPGQPVPKEFPGRGALAVAAAAFMIIAGAAVAWRRSAPWGAIALAAFTR